MMVYKHLFILLLSSCLITQTAEVGVAAPRAYTAEQRAMIAKIKKHLHVTGYGLTDQDILKQALAQGIHPDDIFEDRYHHDAVLHGAIYNDDIPYVMNLIAHKADVRNELPAAGSLPMAQLLIAHKAVPNEALLFNNRMLHEPKLALLLFNAGVDFAKIDEHGDTALTMVLSHYHCANGHTEENLCALAHYLVALGVPTEKPAHYEGPFVQHETVIQKRFVTDLSTYDPSCAQIANRIRTMIQTTQQECDTWQKRACALDEVLKPFMSSGCPRSLIIAYAQGQVIPDDIVRELEALPAPALDHCSLQDYLPAPKTADGFFGGAARYFSTRCVIQ